MTITGYHFLPYTLPHGYPPLSGGEYLSILLFKIPSVNLHRRASSALEYRYSFRAPSFHSPGMGPVLVTLRPSSEVTDDPSKLAGYLFGVGLIDLPLRASHRKAKA